MLFLFLNRVTSLSPNPFNSLHPLLSRLHNTIFTFFLFSICYFRILTGRQSAKVPRVRLQLLLLLHHGLLTSLCFSLWISILRFLPICEHSEYLLQSNQFLSCHQHISAYCMLPCLPACLAGIIQSFLGNERNWDEYKIHLSPCTLPSILSFPPSFLEPRNGAHKRRVSVRVSSVG